MRVYDMIVDERRRMADLLSGLTAEQLRQESLCAGWTVHDVAAHLITFLRFGQVKLYLGIVATGADIDRIMVTLARREARRPISEIISRLRRWSGSRVTIPRSGCVTCAWWSPAGELTAGSRGRSPLRDRAQRAARPGAAGP